MKQHYTLSLSCRNDESLSNGSSEVRNLSLCWINTIKRIGTTPYNAGYYFNDYPQASGKVYYAPSLTAVAKEVADFSALLGLDYSLLNNVIAVSPKHGSIVTGLYDVVPGKGLAVLEDNHCNIINIPMQAWLYNTGIEFVCDEAGEEYCLFGEFSHKPAPVRRVFKGRYPYSDANNWKVVYEVKGDMGGGGTFEFLSDPERPLYQYSVLHYRPQSKRSNVPLFRGFG